MSHIAAAMLTVVAVLYVCCVCFEHLNPSSLYSRCRLVVIIPVQPPAPPISRLGPAAGLKAMNARNGFGFANWPNIEKYPFNLGYTDHCNLGSIADWGSIVLPR